MKQIIFTLLSMVAVFSTSGIGAEKEELYLKGNNATDYAIDLAHPEKGKTKLPVGAANIQSIVETGKYIIGVTKPEHKNRSPLIFRFNIKEEKLVDYIDFNSIGEKGHNASMAIVVGKNNMIYFGTYGDTNSTGKLYQIDASGDKLKVEPLGPIAKKKGIFTITLSAAGDKLYGILSPNNVLFTYDLKTRKSDLFNEAQLDSSANEEVKGIVNKGEPAGVLNGREAALCKALVVDGDGKVFGSTDKGVIFFYDPKINKIKRPGINLPYAQYRRTTNHVQSWVLADNGKLYGGTTLDGYLFSLDPKTLELINLGKPSVAGNIKSMIIRNNVIHGLVGEGLEYTHYFTYDITKGNFEDVGLFRFTNKLINGRHRTYTASQMLSLKDGRILIAEDDLLPMLLFYKP